LARIEGRAPSSQNPSNGLSLPVFERFAEAFQVVPGHARRPPLLAPCGHRAFDLRKNGLRPMRANPKYAITDIGAIDGQRATL